MNEDSNRTVDAPMTSFTVDNLVPDTEWTFSIAASTSKGIGARSASIGRRTLPDGIVDSSQVTGICNCGLLLLDPVRVVLSVGCPTLTATETAAVITLVKPSERNGKIGYHRLI